MDNYRIKGGRALAGEVEISGAKNAALPIIAAAVMTTGETYLDSCPHISDVDSMMKILDALGCKISREKNRLYINADTLDRCSIPDHLMKEMRSSVFLAGALLTRCGEAVISSPGGCNIGKRPIDIHIDGLKKLGADVEQQEGILKIRAVNMRGTDICLPYPSVGATENLIMAAVGAKGKTRIINSAREPEIINLQDYINKCGGKVSGAGTSIIIVEGGRKLVGCEHVIIPDRIEAGTYLLMALATGGKIELKGADENTLIPLLDLLKTAGYSVSCEGSHISAASNGNEKIKCSVSTAPYPGFPTDLQPQLTSFLTKCGKGSVVEENIFEKRFEYVEQMKKMGADIEIFENKVIINNNNILCGAHVEAKDLRGGAALMIAAFMAEGESVVHNTKYIKRGYSDIIEKIVGLGGEIAEYED